MKTITKITDELKDQICWGATYEASFLDILTLHFGEPHLHIVHEPCAQKTSSDRSKELASRRMVSIDGKWELTLFCKTNWELTVGDSLTATPSSPDELRMKVMAWLNGQKFKGLLVNPDTGATEFTFDLGARLKAWRTEKDDSDIWSLRQPAGLYLGVRGDGTFTCCNGDTPRNEQQPIKISDC